MSVVVAVMVVMVLVVLGWVEVSLVYFLEGIPSDANNRCPEQIIPRMLVSHPLF